MINKVFIGGTDLVQRGDGGLPVLGDEPQGSQRRLAHVGRLPVNHLDGHDAQAPDVHLFPVLLLVHNLRMVDN